MIRITLQVILIALPLILFGIYRIVTSHRREPGQPWPIIGLVVAGLVLSFGFYVFLFFSEPREERTCVTPPEFVNGELVPSRTIPCENASIDSRRHDVERQSGVMDEDVSAFRQDGLCYRAPRMVDGVMQPSARVPCDEVNTETAPPSDAE